jgi:hypothetical protein
MFGQQRKEVPDPAVPALTKEVRLLRRCCGGGKP